MPEHRFDKPSELDAALAATVAAKLKAAIDARDHAVLVVSGGSTPKGLFTCLAESSLAWEKVTVLLADERWVPHAHKDCNERLVQKHLLVGKACGATLLSLVAGYPDMSANLAQVKQLLANIGTFDVVILGMGLDGHTASLFPDAPELAEGLATTEGTLMTFPRKASHSRITLSYRRLRDTSFGVVHIVGQNKLSVLDQARRQNNQLAHPVVSFLGGDNPFEVYFAP